MTIHDVGRLVVAAIAVFLPLNAFAQVPPPLDYEKFLVPIVLGRPVSGAHGSSWIDEFWIMNKGDAPVYIHPMDVGCSVPGCALPPTPRGVAFAPRLGFSQRMPGRYLYVERDGAEKVHFSLRLRDVSRQAETFGTSIPVVSEDEFRSGKLHLLPVPTDRDFRFTLRVYSLEGRADTRVRVSVYGINPSSRMPPEGTGVSDSLLGSTTIALFPIDFLDPAFAEATRSQWPAYAQLGDLETVATLNGFSHVRLEISSETPGAKVWAFAAIVHNTSQHLTVVTPQ